MLFQVVIPSIYNHNEPLDISVNKSFKSRLKDNYQLDFINDDGSNGDYGQQQTDIHHQGDIQQRQVYNCVNSF